MKKSLILTLSLIFSIPFSGLARDWYISANGKDTNPGTKEQPRRSLQKIQSKLRPGDTVFIQPGKYNQSLVLDNKGGTAAAPITLKKAGAEPVIFTVPDRKIENPEYLAAEKMYKFPAEEKVIAISAKTSADVFYLDPAASLNALKKQKSGFFYDKNEKVCYSKIRGTAKEITFSTLSKSLRWDIRSSYVILDGLTFHTCHGIAISGNNVKILNCRIENVLYGFTSGLWINGKNVSVKNTILNDVFNGIILRDAKQFSMVSSTISNTFGHGIYFVRKCDNITLKNNIIQPASGDAIYFENVPETIESDYNNMIPSKVGRLVYWAPAKKFFRTLEEYQEESGDLEEHSISERVVFENDFKLPAKHPSRNSGENSIPQGATVP
ncbi:MAG: right-handed parallel beta-helix repeat-containing protein [Lentisphaeria bacterium]|nr:right-handed parallel beta-helix repeat-containing protein [Lentisphaeria bacterium]